MFETCVSFALKIEGGLVFNPRDAGGITNFGISINLLSAYRKTICTADDIRALTIKDARAIYQEAFWNALGLDQFNGAPSFQLALFDFAVNSGQGSAVRTLQNVLTDMGQPLKADGEIGERTRASINLVVNASSDVKLAVNLTRARRILMARICERDKTQILFLAGWIDRTHKLEDAMTALAQVK